MTQQKSATGKKEVADQLVHFTRDHNHRRVDYHVGDSAKVTARAKKKLLDRDVIRRD